MKLKATILSIILTLTLILSCVSASADGSINVTVSIANGGLVLAEANVSVNDADSDGAITINDALICAHKAGYKDGESGFASVSGDYGLSMTKLWGVENGGGYGYYLNNASAMSLADPLKAGDRVYAFVYTDTATFSDSFTFFDKASASVKASGELELTLSVAGYDENWSPITLPVEGATITVNGEKTNIKTDKNGKAVITLDKAGSYNISAVSENAVLVPAICVATVSEASPQTSDSGTASLVIISICMLFALCTLKRRSSYAK